MELSDLGFNDTFQRFITENNIRNCETGRIIAEHKERYIVWTPKGEFEAEITGNLRYTAKNRKDFPAVGDWVILLVYDQENAIIQEILPRYSLLVRRAAGKREESQVIGANIDYAFLVQAIDRDFNINRLERYLSICYSGKVNPIIVLSKTDLINEENLSSIIDTVKRQLTNIPVIAISNETSEGLTELKLLIESGKTYCLLGSSGVGKSTLVNNLISNAELKTAALSLSTGKGKHTTSHRELFILENGGIIIDNPGMREVGITNQSEGLAVTFENISKLSQNCRYTDCTHKNERGCAVIEAVESGELDQESYQNYLKLKREQDHFELSLAERRKKDKDFGKMLKNYMKDLKRNNQK